MNLLDILIALHDAGVSDLTRDGDRIRFYYRCRCKMKKVKALKRQLLASGLRQKLLPMLSKDWTEMGWEYVDK